LFILLASVGWVEECTEVNFTKSAVFITVGNISCDSLTVIDDSIEVWEIVGLDGLDDRVDNIISGFGTIGDIMDAVIDTIKFDGVTKVAVSLHLA
jgi:predicted short-subunit dehydrogenase-like oxidoreductase (DUF2520 family)